MMDDSPRSEISGFRPLTAENWPDLETLFGPRGACAGCWCMYWRLPRRDYERQAGAANRLALKGLAESGRPPGILAYQAGRPVGWCAIAPREDYPVLGRSRVLKPVDEQAVWSVTCFFIARKERGHGLMSRLLEAATQFAFSQGAEIVEGYPIEPKSGKTGAVFLYTGVASAFINAGFTEVARRSPTRPIFRRHRESQSLRHTVQ